VYAENAQCRGTNIVMAPTVWATPVIQLIGVSWRARRQLSAPRDPEMAYITRYYEYGHALFECVV
jgi:hypothetical protein